MSLYVGYCYSRRFTEEEAKKIDELVIQNREVTYGFLKKSVSDLRQKFKIVRIYLIFSFSTSQIVYAGVMLPQIPSINRMQQNPDYIFKTNKQIPQPTKIIKNRDRVCKATFSKKEIDQFEKIIKNYKNGSVSLDDTIAALRGGDLVEDITVIILIIFIANLFHWTEVEAFNFNGLPFQLQHRVNLFGYQQGDHVPYQGNNPKAKPSYSRLSKQILTALYESKNPTTTQVYNFVTNGKIDLQKAFQEVQRRIFEMGRSKNYNCAFNRFQALATENGRITISSTKEAITIIQGELYGYYANARRLFYGPGINGPDFGVMGLGQYKDVTHVDVKNPVGTRIRIANGQDSDLFEQGESIGLKFLAQRERWSNPEVTSKVPHVDPAASFPTQGNNYLGLFDCFDVPVGEKPLIQAAIMGSLGDDIRNVIFMNNDTNI